MESSETQLPETRAVEDKYDIIRKIGEGASAETFLAEDRETSERVVIKSLHVEKLDGWKFFELFEREANTLSGLNHAGVPNFIEWFASKSENDRPRFHIVQEYIEGKPLAEIINGGGMSEAEFDQLALGMLDILNYLHSRTPPVFHRDIKPSNIIIREMGAPVLIDFGSVTSGWRAEDERGSTVAGTHGYMPPEQYMGQVSTRSDLYGLGATLLHVVSGRAPSEFSFDDGRINVPQDLAVRRSTLEALNRLLEPAPRDRPQSAKEARKLFVSGSSSEIAVVPKDGQKASATDLMVVESAVVKLENPDGTHFVDLGKPLRDPNGEFKDVFQSLDTPFYTLSVGNEGVNRIAQNWSVPAQVLVWAVMVLLTFGIWPLTRLMGRSERARRAELFRTGIFRRATVVGISPHNQMSSRVTYEFELDGERVQTSCLVVSTDASHMVAGDVYGVLYEFGNPTNSTIVYR